VPQNNLSTLAGVRPELLPRGRSTFPPAIGSGATTQFLTCQYYGSDCSSYDGSGNFQFALASGLSEPQGDATGTYSKHWYVANTGDSNVPYYSVTTSGATLLGTIADAGNYPVDVAVGETGTKKGLKTTSVLISNLFTTALGPGSAIYISPGGVTSTLAAPGTIVPQGIGVAFDKSAKDCFWSVNDLSTGLGSVVYYKGCAGPGKAIVSNLGFAGGIALDGKNNLWVTDQLQGVYKCAKSGKNCALVFSGFTDPNFIAFSADYGTLYVADQSAAAVDACSVASGKCTTAVSDAGGISDPNFGVAVLPAAAP
jgi:hypothetical protein